MFRMKCTLGKESKIPFYGKVGDWCYRQTAKLSMAKARDINYIRPSIRISLKDGIQTRIKKGTFNPWDFSPKEYRQGGE